MTRVFLRSSVVLATILAIGISLGAEEPGKKNAPGAPAAAPSRPASEGQTKDASATATGKAPATSAPSTQAVNKAIAVGFTKIADQGTDPDSAFYKPIWSPDGRFVACTYGKNVSQKTPRAIGGPIPPPADEVWICDLSTGKNHKVAKNEEGWFYANLAWSADGQFLYFVQTTYYPGVAENAGVPGRLLRVKPEASDALPTTIAAAEKQERFAGPLAFILSPDGKQVAVYGGMPATELKVPDSDIKVIDLMKDSFSSYTGNGPGAGGMMRNVMNVLPWKTSPPPEPREDHFKLQKSGGVLGFPGQGAGLLNGKETKFPGRTDGLLFGKGGAALWSGPVRRPGDPEVYAFSTNGEIWIYRVPLDAQTETASRPAPAHN